MAKGGIELSRELYRRLNGRLTMQQCMLFIQHGLAQISAAGSMVWDQVLLSPATPVLDPSGLFNTVALSQLDLGKKIAVWNTNGTPVVRVAQNEAVASAAGYKAVGAAEYNCFAIGTSGGDAALMLFPFFNPTQNVTVMYHQLPPALEYAASPTTRWNVPVLDDLLLDIAEIEAKRVVPILSPPVTPQHEQAVMEELERLTLLYSTERINTGPEKEQASMQQEKNSLGRT